ncbi:MAG: GNAT family N-acetyltransferase [Deltaproteobacteria bacterium]|nr:MAG: GNAT family N-acetyltransferase [Deltaproteobacteria bacterium]
MKIIIEFSPPLNEIKYLESKLFQHNRKKIENYSYEQFILKVVDSSNSIIAGIHCKIGGNWLYIESLWVEKEYRSQGLGKELLIKAEKIASEKKCFGVYLYTYSFQNPGFYQKLGYNIFGTLENFCNENSKLYMKKILV